jgi:hypothetical protein
MTYRHLFALLWLTGFGTAAHADPIKPTVVAPVVDASSGQLYGAASGTGWLPARDAEAFMKKGLTFRVYANDGSFLQKRALTRVRTSEICANPTYRPGNKASLPPRSATLVGAPWDAAPRKPSALDQNNPAYREAVSGWLRDRGINDPKPILSQLWRIDLEGDGRAEVLIAASRHRGSATSTASGDYSVLLMRKLAGDNVVTMPIKSDLYPEACIAECALAVHEVFGALDLNGDGHLEIIVKSSAYESITQAIHSVDDARVVKRLEWSCGS